MVESLREIQFLSIDLETTGLDYKKDEILAVGAVPLQGTKIMVGERYYRVFRPERFKIESMKYHGLGPSELQVAENFSEVAWEVYRLLEGKVIVGYAVEIDYQFLKKALGREGYTIKNRRIDVIDFERALSYILGERFAEATTLEKLAEKYGVRVDFRHNALADAFITAQIFQIQMLRLLKYGIKTLEGLTELLKRTERAGNFHIF